MLEPTHNNELPPIPGKRYFTIGEVSELCAVKPHVLRYWEQEFPTAQSPLSAVVIDGTTSAAMSNWCARFEPVCIEEGYTIGGARQS